MSLRDCLNSAVAQGALSKEQADELHSFYQRKVKSKGDTASGRAEAKTEAVAELRAKAELQKRQALLSEAARSNIIDVLSHHRTIYGKESMLDGALSLMVHNGYFGSFSMEGRKNAIIGLAHRKLSDVMYNFRKTNITGRYRNTVGLTDIVRAMHGDPVANPAAKKMALAIRGVYEELRQRFNSAGGNIPKRDDHGLPHSHNLEKIRALGDGDIKVARQKWKDFIRPLLDPERMANPYTGEVIGHSGLDDSLDHVFDSISSDNLANLDPKARALGKGTLANRHQDARFLVFKNGDAWLEYNQRFGNSDVVSTIFDHVNGMARDIAAMERFGPNPDATMQWMVQVVQKDLGERMTGKKGSRLPGISEPASAQYRIESLWQRLRGSGAVWQAPAALAEDVRNVGTAAALAGTVITSAVTDPAVAQASRLLAGLPMVSDAKGVLARLVSGDTDRLHMARAGVIWDDFLHTANESARGVEMLYGSEWSRYLVDRTLTYTGLKPLTEARKRTEAGAWFSELGNQAGQGKDWIDLHPLLKKAMEGFGFVAEDWHKMRDARDAMGFITPASIMQKTGDRDLAEKLGELVSMWSERAVPEGDPRISSAIMGNVKRGTIPGELTRFALQFMSFALSFTARQLEAMHVYSSIARTRTGKIARGTYYFARLAVPLTVGAGIAIQIKALLAGKDPEDMTSPAFWVKAFAKGGGAGIFADFISKAENRYGQGFAQSLGGIGAAFVGDTLDLGSRALRAPFLAMAGSEEGSGFGRKLPAYVGRYSPFVSTAPVIGLVWQRAFVDQLQWLTDPKAEESFKAKKRSASYWWEPGRALPSRLPDLRSAFGEVNQVR